ncbi:MAG: phenylalanine--tRNA ligase subunit beta [Deltaproteobacteria bacterium]|nr:phenylalanine--tRNA ligase subunit beta [Deltaproteobacteria bacterium]
MKVLLSWLQEFFQQPLVAEEIAKRLTFAGLEVELITKLAAGWSDVYAAKLLEVNKHPNADRLSLCQVQWQNQILEVVCGASNMKAGDVVALAIVGAKLPGGMEIKKSKIRGAESFGMLCSEKELGLADTSAGIMILPPPTPLGEPLSDILKMQEAILEINVTPNRGDCLSMRGIAREVAALLDQPLQRVGGAFPLKNQIANPTNVSIQAPNQGLRYATRLIKNLAIKSSPLWVQQRLQRAGLRPINQVVDATNYVMLELGHPLHAFDLSTIEGGEIKVRIAKSGESLLALDDKTYALTTEDLVIADTKKVLALAGVMGGAFSSVKEGTKDLLLESACFLPESIRKTSRRLNLASESSYRFERWVDPNTVVEALDRLTELIVQWSEGSALEVSAVVDRYPQKIESPRVSLRNARVEKVLGTQLNVKKFLPQLQHLGLDFSEQPEGYTVSIPTFRSDLTREIDLIEEVVRLAGYDTVPAHFPKIALNQLPQVELNHAKMAREYLMQKGFAEAVNFSFISEAELKTWGGQGVRLANPISDSWSYLRTSILPGLIQNMRWNLARGQKDIKLFEIGNIFYQQSKVPGERNALGMVACGNRGQLHFSQAPVEVDFYFLKGVLQGLLSDTLQQDFSIKSSNINMLHPKRQVSVEVDGQKIGFLGEIHPSLVQKEELPTKTILCEIYLDEIKLKHKGKVVFQALSPFPSVWRDLNLILDEKVQHAEVEKVIETAQNPWIRKLELFDIYRGKPLTEGQKALTYSIEYGTQDRTLTDEEVNEAHHRLIEKLQVTLKASLRT